jgi:hypothetical protein
MYPLGSYLVLYITSTMASQGLTKIRKIPNPLKHDDTKSSQKKNMAQAWPRKTRS